MKLADGHINLIAADSALQKAGSNEWFCEENWGINYGFFFVVVVADGIADYFNNNPSKAIETMQRFYEAYPDDTITKDLINQQLVLVPEAEILPEW